MDLSLVCQYTFLLFWYIYILLSFLTLADNYIDTIKPFVYLYTLFAVNFPEISFPPEQINKPEVIPEGFIQSTELHARS